MRITNGHFFANSQKKCEFLCAPNILKTYLVNFQIDDSIYRLFSLRNILRPKNHKKIECIDKRLTSREFANSQKKCESCSRPMRIANANSHANSHSHSHSHSHRM